MYKINLKSRWDIFDMDYSTLPEGPILAQGDDNWFLTSKDYLMAYDSFSRDMENLLMYGK